MPHRTAKLTPSGSTAPGPADPIEGWPPATAADAGVAGRPRTSGSAAIGLKARPVSRIARPGHDAGPGP